VSVQGSWDQGSKPDSNPLGGIRGAELGAFSLGSAPILGNAEILTWKRHGGDVRAPR